MKKTTYQIPEIRDDKDNILQSGTYGKNSPLCNDTNDGVLDYINNNLEYLKSAQDGANKSIDSANKRIENITTEYATKNELKSASDASTASLAQKISADAQAITTKALTVTGETVVPTANAGNKSNTIANTEFVQNTIANLVDSAPETLNTLNELAKALNNDPNFATTITNLIAEKESKQDAGVAHTELTQKIDSSIAQAHHYIKRNTAYSVGDVLTSTNLPYGTIIVITQAGTTGDTEPDWDTIKNNLGGVVSDGTAQFKTVTLYEDTEYHDYSTLTVTNGTIMEPTNTYWIKRGKWIYVNISGILTNDGKSLVYISGLPAPAYRVNASMFSNKSTRCIGLFSNENGKFIMIPTGAIEQLYASFSYMI